MNKLTPEWSKLVAAPEDKKIEALFEYCQSYIDQHKSGDKREEEVGYAICGIHSAQFHIPDDIDQLIDMACQLEIGRDTTYFYGKEVWNQKDADIKKEKEYAAFVTLYEKLKTKYLS